MTKQGAKTAVPRLRFPEFRAARGWVTSNLGNAGKFIRGLTYAASDVQHRGLLVLRSTNIQDGVLVLDQDLVFVEKDCAPDQVLQFGDIAICMSNGSKALVGKSAEFKGNYPGRLTVGAFCSIFRPKLPFAKLAFQTEQYADFVAMAIGGGNINNLKNSDLENLEFPIPESSVEQQKIADCLASLDEVIAAQARKVEALKTHKRGLMQQLFPREGETLPRLRFPEFRDAPQWANKLLGEAATFYNGRAYAKEELLERGKYQVLRVGNFFSNDHWYYSDLELDDAKYCDSGDLLYAWSASFGPRMWHGGKTIYHYHIWKVVESEGVDRKFLFYRLDSDTERMRARAANGIGMFHITKGTIENWMSSFPGYDEQQRIADCLSSLDTRIAAETNQFAALKTHKQGLMQQLFPAQVAD